MTRNPKDICSAATTSSPDVRAHGGGLVSPAAPNTASFFARLRDSVWAPIVLKAGGGCIALCALGLMGAASLHARPGVELAPVGTEWVAAADAPAAPSAVSSTSAPRAGSRGGHGGEASGGPATKQLPPCMPTGAAANAVGSSGAASGAQSTGAPTGGVLADGRVVLNAASADELRRLPGIGPSKAEAIVELRTRLKKFRRVTELLRVRGIGPKNLKRLEPLVVLDAPVEPQPVEGALSATGPK